MTTWRSPQDYFGQHYPADLKVFASDALCGFTLGDALHDPKRGRFIGLAEFVVCQFELNLLNQAVYTHDRSVFWAWRQFSAPFADTHGCSMGHGMGNHLPVSILRFAQESFASPATAPVQLDWEILRAYTQFFLRDYLAQFQATEAGASFSKAQFLAAVATDFDCTACVRSPDGWTTRHVSGLVSAEERATK